ncbi:MAG: hypothetical protein Q8M56_01155 [Desulfobacterales bacterium]|jgi:hypothetical protein|nr:hypothetical protein [Desulfobacterales bacterium]
MNNKYISVILIVTVIGISLFLPGCGKKGLPVPPRQVALPAVNDLAAVLEGDRVILTWTAPVIKETKGPLITGFVVHKAKNQVQESGCKNCPVKYEAVAEIAAGHEGESKKIEYTGRIERGYKYYFKVKAFSEKINALGIDSNIVEFIY